MEVDLSKIKEGLEEGKKEYDRQVKEYEEEFTKSKNDEEVTSIMGVNNIISEKEKTWENEEVLEREYTMRELAKISLETNKKIFSGIEKIAPLSGIKRQENDKGEIYYEIDNSILNIENKKNRKYIFTENGLHYLIHCNDLDGGRLSNSPEAWNIVRRVNNEGKISGSPQELRIFKDNKEIKENIDIEILTLHPTNVIEEKQYLVKELKDIIDKIKDNGERNKNFLQNERDYSEKLIEHLFNETEK